MNTKYYLHYTKLLFAAVFLMHGLRAVKGWTLHLNGAPIPMWVSWLGVILTGYFAYTAHKLKK